MLRVDHKHYIWQELVKKFPEQWVVVENPVLDDGGFIISGELIGVCSDDEVDDFVVSCYKENKQIIYERTTEGSGTGVVNVENFSYTVK